MRTDLLIPLLHGFLVVKGLWGVEIGPEFEPLKDSGSI